MRCSVSPARTTKSPTAKAGLDQAVPVTVDCQGIEAPGYPVRREAYTRDDERRDSGVSAAVRKHSSTDPTCSPIVVKLGPHAKRAMVSCQRDRMRNRGRQLPQLAGCPNAFGFAQCDRIGLIQSLVGIPFMQR